MKLKLFYLVIFTGVYFFSCSNEFEDRYFYNDTLFINVSDDKNCLEDDTNCRRIYVVSDSEYYRITNLRNHSEDKNLFISGKGRYSENGECLGLVGLDSVEETFEGYLIKAYELNCWSDYDWTW